MSKQLAQSLILIILIIISFTTFCGFSPAEELLHKENYFNIEYQNAINYLKENRYEESLKNLEIYNIINGLYFTIEKENIYNILNNYKDILINQANNYLNSGDNTTASNLLNSRKKYYKDDNTITNLINYNKQILDSNNLVEYTGNIEHLTFNTLMAFPEKALDSRNSMSNTYDETKLTTKEFFNIINSLYKNNYILVNINDLYTQQSNKIVKNKLFLPKNKKPLILSFDNVSYKSSYQNLGEIDKFILDRNNNIATYTTKKSIQERIQYDNEFVVILEDFIENHPDFSYNNARGIIFLTGENGIFGYNTNHKNASNKYEAKKASEVVKKLKNLGWVFGCNNYTYSEESLLSDIEFAKELSLWNKEVKTIIGETNLYAYPYGNHNEKETSKQELLTSNGFNLFFINSNTPTLEFKNDICIMSRREINGTSLRNNKSELIHLFDCEKVYDHTNRTITYYKLTQ